MLPSPPRWRSSQPAIGELHRPYRGIELYRGLMDSIIAGFSHGWRRRLIGNVVMLPRQVGYVRAATLEPNPMRTCIHESEPFRLLRTRRDSLRVR